MAEKGRLNVILGLQRGDEGKGRFVDLLAQKHDIVARFNGGPNAGHSIALNKDLEFKLHQVPAGVLYPGKLNVAGNGMLIDPIRLLAEIAEIRAAGREVTPKNFAISDAAHMILPHHILLDEMREAGAAKQGSTKRGIAYAAADKYERSGARAELVAEAQDELLARVTSGLQRVYELTNKTGNPEAEARAWLKEAVKLKPFITDTVNLVRGRLESGDTMLAEGAQAFAIDIEHGMYPYVTSSHTTIGGVLNGLGVGPQHLGKVTGVVKAVKSHVGDGPFVSEITDEKLADKIRGERGKIDSEYGTSTGRPRRVGYLDLPELKPAIKLNGVSEIALTKLDTLARYGKSMPVAVKYKYLGQEINEAPGNSAVKLAKCQPVYEEVELWQEDISEVKRFEDLPANAQKLVKWLEEQLEVPIAMIGVGPNRDQVILRSS